MYNNNCYKSDYIEIDGGYAIVTRDNKFVGFQSDTFPVGIIVVNKYSTAMQFSSKELAAQFIENNRYKIAYLLKQSPDTLRIVPITVKFPVAEKIIDSGDNK